MRKRASKVTEIRSRIILEAASMMRISGHSDIGIVALMKRIDRTHGGFYTYFSSRDDLVVHAVNSMFEETKQLRTLSGGDYCSIRELHDLVDAYLSREALTSPQTNCPIPSLIAEANRFPIAAKASFAAGMASFQDAITNVLKNTKDKDPYGSASSILAEMIGAMILARNHINPDIAAELLDASRRKIRNRISAYT